MGVAVNGSSWWSRSLAALLLVGFAVALPSVTAGAEEAAAIPSPLPAVKHVFVIVLENKGYDETFTADSKAPYLSRELPKLGQVLTNFYGTGHFSLTNYVAMVSGQAPTPETNGDCLASYKDLTPGTPADDGQVVGTGCIYPAAVKTIAAQLTTKGLTWKGYFGDMGTPCRHPDANAPDTTLKVKPGDQYAARHNPFIYFHSVLDTSACKNNDVDLSQLSTDLASAATTPNYVFISPNVCDDGHDGPCVDGAPGGLESADAFLKTWVPKILDTPQYQSGTTAVFITFDEDDSSNNNHIATLVLSPSTPAGLVDNGSYNHYSMLRTTEELLGLPVTLGGAVGAMSMRAGFHL